MATHGVVNKKEGIMDTTIFYFTGTGNSLWASRYLASKLGNARLVSLPLAEGGAFSFPAGQRIGIVFPVIMFGLPLIVKRFLETAPLPNNTYNFAVATCGGMPCGTLDQAARLLGNRGLQLSAGFSVAMVNNCTAIAEAVSPEKQRQRLDRAAATLDRVCAKIKNQERQLDKGMPVLNWYFSGIIHQKAESRIGTAAQYFYTDSNCNGCGLCEKVCPVRNIAMNAMKPVWKGQCEQCYACLQWCPRESVQVKNKKTEGRRRYHHPEMTAADLRSEN